MRIEHIGIAIFIAVIALGFWCDRFRGEMSASSAAATPVVVQPADAGGK